MFYRDIWLVGSPSRLSLERKGQRLLVIVQVYSLRKKICHQSGQWGIFEMFLFLHCLEIFFSGN